MAFYDVEDRVTGIKLRLEGDSPPTEQELEEIFAQYSGPGAVQPTPAAPAAQQPTPMTPPAAPAAPDTAWPGGPKIEPEGVQPVSADVSPMPGAGETAFPQQQAAAPSSTHVDLGEPDDVDASGAIALERELSRQRDFPGEKLPIDMDASADPEMAGQLSERYRSADYFEKHPELFTEPDLAARGLMRGIFKYGVGIPAGLVGWMGGVLDEAGVPGGEKLMKWGAEKHQDAMVKSEEFRRNVDKDFFTVAAELVHHGEVGQFATFALEGMFELLPQTAVWITYGLVMKGLGAVAAPVVGAVAGGLKATKLGMAAAKSPQLVRAAAVFQKAMTSALAKRVATQGVPSTLMYLGGNWAEVYNELGENNPGSAIASALGAGLTTMMVPGGSAKHKILSGILGEETANSFTRAVAAGNTPVVARVLAELAKNTGHNMWRAALEEFGQESFALANLIANSPDVDGVGGMIYEYFANIRRPASSAGSVMLSGGLPGGVRSGMSQTMMATQAKEAARAQQISELSTSDEVLGAVAEAEVRGSEEGAQFGVKVPERQRTAQDADLQAALQEAQQGTQQEADTEQAGEEQQQTEKYERRKDQPRRKLVEEMTADEMRQALLVDELLNIGSRRAYDDAPKKAVQGIIDVDGLKWFNDNLGYAAGDALLQAVAAAASKGGVEAYRTGGDEISFQGDSDKSVDNQIKKVYDILGGGTIEVEASDGQVITYIFPEGAGFSYGMANVEGEVTNESVKSAKRRAENALHAHKSERERSGLRSPRGERPPGISEQLASRLKTGSDIHSESEHGIPTGEGPSDGLETTQAGTPPKGPPKPPKPPTTPTEPAGEQPEGEQPKPGKKLPKPGEPTTQKVAEEDAEPLKPAKTPPKRRRPVIRRTPKEVRESTRKAAELERASKAIRGKLISIPKEQELQRAQLQVEINNYDKARHDEIVKAIYDYGRGIKLHSEPYNRVDTLLKNTKTAAGLQKALDIMDKTMLTKTTGRLRKRVAETIKREQARLKKLQSKTARSMGDAQQNKEIKEYIDDLLGRTAPVPIDASKAEAVVKQLTENPSADLSPEMVAAATELLAEPKKAVKDMTAKELLKVLKDIKGMREEGKQTRKQAAEERDRKFQESKKKMLKEVGEAPVEDPLEAAERKKREKTWIARRKTNVEKYFRSLLRPERIARWFGGWHRDSEVYKQTWMKALAANHTEMRTTKGDLAVIKDIFKGFNAAKSRTTVVATIQDSKGNDHGVSLETAMKVYGLNQNENGRKHLMGSGLTAESIESIIESVPDRERNIVDQIIDYFDGPVYDRINRVFEAIHGVPLSKQDRYLPFGKISYEHSTNAFIAEQLAHRGMEKGFLETRTGSEAALENLFVGDLYESVIKSLMDSGHYAAWEQPLMEIRKVLNDKDIRRSMRAKDGSGIMYDNLVSWVNDVGYGKIRRSEHVLDRFSEVFRHNFVLAKLGLNVLVPIKQVGSLTRGLADVSHPSYVLEAGSRLATSPLATLEFIRASSIEMETRAHSFERELAEMAEKDREKFITNLRNAPTEFKNMAMVGISALDGITASTVWLSKYLDVLDHTDSHESAVDAADHLVSTTQPMGGLMHLPAIYRTRGLARDYTVFTNDVNQAVNTIWEMASDKERSGSKNAWDMFMKLIIPATVIYWASNGLRFRKDDPEGLIEAMLDPPLRGLVGYGMIAKAGVKAVADRSRTARGAPTDKFMSRYMADLTPASLSWVAEMITGLTEEDVGKMLVGGTTAFGISGVIQTQRAIRGIEKAKETGDPRYALFGPGSMRETPSKDFPTRDMWGERTNQNYFTRLMAPAFDEKPDAFNQSLIDVGMRMTGPNTRIGVNADMRKEHGLEDKKSLEMSAEEYDALVTVGGPEAKRAVKAVLESDEYAAADEEEKRNLVTRAYSNTFAPYRDAMRDIVIERHKASEDAKQTLTRKELYTRLRAGGVAKSVDRYTDSASGSMNWRQALQILEHRNLKDDEKKALVELTGEKDFAAARRKAEQVVKEHDVGRRATADRRTELAGFAKKLNALAEKAKKKQISYAEYREQAAEIREEQAEFRRQYEALRGKK
jgi:GGDEF domain-containing protein